MPHTTEEQTMTDIDRNNSHTDASSEHTALLADATIPEEAPTYSPQLQEDEETPDESNEDVNYSAMKVAELKELLKEKELPVSGTKAELIERLQT